MSLSLYMDFQPTERRQKMERGTKTPSYCAAYFRWFLEAFLTSVALELIQTDVGLRKLALILLKPFVIPRFCSPLCQPHKLCTSTVWQLSRLICCSLLALELCMKIYIIETNFFNSRIFTLIISIFNFLYNTT